MQAWVTCFKEGLGLGPGGKSHSPGGGVPWGAVPKECVVTLKAVLKAWAFPAGFLSHPPHNAQVLYYRDITASGVLSVPKETKLM